MASRLWTNPPLKPDGSLDYSQLTVAEICEDLSESLMDLIENGGIVDLQKFLEDLPPEDGLPTTLLPTDALVSFMEAMLLVEDEDFDFRSAQAQDAIPGAIREIRVAAGVA